MLFRSPYVPLLTTIPGIAWTLGYTIAADLSGYIFRLYRPPGLPTSIFVGPEGAIRSVVLAPLTEADGAAQIEAVLPKQ